jgi:stearoyl-CoA desaturase (delta-9 desaturase)
MLLVNVVLFGPIGLTIWAIQMIWIPITAAGIINGIGHYWGYRNFASEDASRNVLPWGILIGGEELHNNHHAYGTSAKLSSKWYEFDIGWLYIRLMELVGLAKVRKLAPKVRWQPAQNVVNPELLQAVITHRYDVMKRYAGIMKRVCGEEMDKLKQHTHLPKPDWTSLRRHLHLEPTALGSAEKAGVDAVLRQSEALHKVYTMRQELTALWERSSLTKEQLVKQLQDWCHRAEASGVDALREFSLRLRCYA